MIRKWLFFGICVIKIWRIDLRSIRSFHYTADEKLAIIKDFVEKGVFL